MHITKRTGRIFLLTILIFFSLSLAYLSAQQTFCNPLNLNYRFMSDVEQAREAADPVMVLYKDDYYLFASRSGGYWTSPDLKDWTFIKPSGLGIIETYAPAVMVLRDTLFYAASANGSTFKTADPKSGVWEPGPSMNSYGDPAFFVDDDQRLYMYYGLSNSNPTSVVELDPHTFKEIGSPVNIVFNNAATHGWERRGDDNLLDEVPWIEGTWMTKHNGKYYLHYSAPGTEFKTYADGIYIADSPLGPYQYADYSPFSFKPTGFMPGAGHGSTFMDKQGKYWRITTAVISVRHLFERRLNLFPVDFDEDGHIRCNTEFGDYPQFFPGVQSTPIDDNFAGMLLLSHKKYVTASSSIDGYGAENAVDEESRTYWAAQTGDAGEWIIVDLGKQASVEAIQVNFGEHGTTPALVRGRDVTLMEQYTIEVSDDGKNWTMLIDKSQNDQDVPHDYAELPEPVQTRYLKLTNVFTPGNGKFAVRGFRVFGNSNKAVFTNADGVTVERDAGDGRDAVVRWTPVADADGYIIRYGIDPDKLYNNYMVYDLDSVAIHSLNHGVDYYFEVEAFDSGLDYYVPVGEHRSGQSGNWNDTNSWEEYNGSAWVPSSTIPDTGGSLVTIRDGHTITVTNDDTVSQVIVSSGGKLVVDSETNLYIKDGPGYDLRISGMLENNGSVSALENAKLVVDNGGTYLHPQSAGIIPIIIWAVGSTCSITGYTSGTKPGNLNQDFYNFIWDCEDQTSNVDWGWYNNTVRGDITILSTGSERAQMTSPGAGSPNTINVLRDINVESGQFTSNGSGSVANITINTYGNINVNGGNFSVSRGSGPTVSWNVYGDFNMENASTQNSNPGGATFIFTGDGLSMLNLAENNTLTALPIEVNNGAILDLGLSVILGSGDFVLHPGATLQTPHVDGLNGNLKMDKAPLLSNDGIFGFTGKEVQQTGLLLPDTVNSIFIENEAGLSLSSSVVVTNILEIRDGTIIPGTHNLSYGEKASLKYAGSTGQVTSDAEFPAATGPKNLIIDNNRGIDLHASRTLAGVLEFIKGRLDIGPYNLTVQSVINPASNRYVRTDDGGQLKQFVGASQVQFPIGSSSYAPVEILNTGTADTISVSVVRELDPNPFGARVRQRWSLNETLDGGGDYTLQFGWVSAGETSDFRNDRESNARIYYADTFVEAGSGSYTGEFSESPYYVSRSGIAQLGDFVVGAFIPSNINKPDNVPDRLMLSQNYPNPFNPLTTIEFTTPRKGNVNLTVYNLLGEKQLTLISEELPAGYHNFKWNAGDMASGIYFYMVKFENTTQVKKALLLK